MQKIKRFYLKGVALAVLLWAFLPIKLAQTAIMDFTGEMPTYWYWTTMGWEIISHIGITTALDDFMQILIVIAITMIPYLLVSLLLVKIGYYFYYKKSRKRQKPKK